MKSYSWFETKEGRLLVVLVTIAVYVALMVTDGIRFFPQNETNVFSLAELSARFGFSAFVAVLFLAVGAFTWVYARDRRLATLLFCFTFVSMISITVQTAAIRGDALLSDVGGASSALSLLPLFALLLFFPTHSLLRLPKKHTLQGGTEQRAPRVHGLLILLAFLCGVTVVDYVYRYTQPGHVPDGLEIAGNIYFPLVILCILVTLPLSYLRSPSQRERQKVRIFLGGILLAFAPLLLLTVLPVVTAHSEYAVDGQISSLFYFVLPLSLGYAVLRPQVLVYDTTIRRTITWIVGTISIGLLGYGIVVSIAIALADHLSLAVLYAGVGCSVVLSPCIWWLASFGTNRLLFEGEAAGYRRILDTATLLPKDRKFDLEHASELLLNTAKEVFETPEACLFVLNTDATSYLMSPNFGENHGDESLQTLLECLQPVLEGKERSSVQQVSQQAVQQLQSSHRPLLLNDMAHTDTRFRPVSHYLNTSPPQEDVSVLLAPMRAQSEMIAILVLGKRADNQPYGGPDFDIVQQLLTRFSTIIETARVTEGLRTAYARLKELDQLKDAFIMTTAHELRTPMTAVYGYLEIVDGQWHKLSEARQQQFVKKAYRSSEEMIEMINTIMDGSGVEQEVEQVKCTSIFLRPIITHVLEVLDQAIARGRHSIHVTCGDDLMVIADDLRVRQVVLNLVTNALKYSAPGTALEIGVDVLVDHVEIGVRDYGLGVPLKDQRHLFERFVRLERDMNSPVRGAGLGLYICRRLVHAMGGTIWIESTGIKGEGSRFVFTLPRALLPLHPPPSDQPTALSFL